jgi:hypothetical protein
VGFRRRWGGEVVTNKSGVQAFTGGLTVRAQGPHRLRSGAVQIVTRRGRAVEQVEHLGSARTDAELALLLSAARDRLSPGQGELDLGDLAAVPPRLNDVADWTSKRHPPAGQTVLREQPAAAPRRGRPAAVKAGGRVVATSSLVLWQVLTAAYARVGVRGPWR